MTKLPESILHKARLPAIALAGMFMLAASSHANAAIVTIISNTETPLPSSIIQDTLVFALSSGGGPVTESGYTSGFSSGGLYTTGLLSTTTGAGGYFSSAIIPFSPNQFALSLGNLGAGLYTTVVKGFSSTAYGAIDLGIQDPPVSAVPIPGSVWMFGAGLGGLLAFAYRRRLTSVANTSVSFA